MIVKHQTWLIASQGANPKSYTVQGQCYLCLAEVRANVDPASVMRALLNPQQPLRVKCDMCQKSLDIHEAESRSEALMPFVGIEIGKHRWARRKFYLV